MEIKELVEKELNKIKQGEFANLNNVKLTSDLGKDIMINIIKNLTIPVVNCQREQLCKHTDEFTNPISTYVAEIDRWYCPLCDSLT